MIHRPCGAVNSIYSMVNVLKDFKMILSKKNALVLTSFHYTTEASQLTSEILQTLMFLNTTQTEIEVDNRWVKCFRLTLMSIGAIRSNPSSTFANIYIRRVAKLFFKY